GPGLSPPAGGGRPGHRRGRGRRPPDGVWESPQRRLEGGGPPGHPGGGGRRQPLGRRGPALRSRFRRGGELLAPSHAAGRSRRPPPSVDGPGGGNHRPPGTGRAGDVEVRRLISPMACRIIDGSTMTAAITQELKGKVAEFTRRYGSPPLLSV